MSYNLSLEREKFSKMLNLMKLLENHATDCDVQHGKIRQKTNNRQSITDIDLTSILGDNDLSLSLIKSKVQLLKSFELDENVQLTEKNILIECNESNYEFTDALSKMIFRKPSQKFLDNKFITDEEFNQVIKCKDENLLFSYTISNYIKKRMISACFGFDTDLITFNLNEFKGHATIQPTNKENTTNYIEEITLNKQVSSQSFQISNLAFILDVASDVNLNCYQVTNDVYLCKISQMYFGVPIIIYTQAKITKN